MKKVVSIALSLGLVCSAGYIAEAKSAAKTYKNCTELNKDYKGGVAESSSAKN